MTTDEYIEIQTKQLVDGINAQNRCSPRDIRERRWKKFRMGLFTASEVEALMTKKGGFDKGAIDLLYQKQWERNNPIPYFRRGNANFDFGHQNEPLAVAWLRENQIELGLVGEIKHCSSEVDFPKDIVFAKTEWGLGGSADVILQVTEKVSDSAPGGCTWHNIKTKSLIEIKCVEGKDWFRYASPTLSLEAKKALVLESHRDQLAAQLLLYPEIDHIYLLKYRPQIDEDEIDLLSPLDPSRGVLFRFERKEFGQYLELLEARVRFCDEYLKSGLDLELINKATMVVGEDGNITFEI